MEIVFLLAAEIDLFEIYDRYGEKLHVKIDAALRHLQDQPNLGVIFRGQFRRKLVLHSPFAIYDKVESNRIMIYALIDQRQDPEAIFTRLGVV